MKEQTDRRRRQSCPSDLPLLQQRVDRRRSHLRERAVQRTRAASAAARLQLTRARSTRRFAAASCSGRQTARRARRSAAGRCCRRCGGCESRWTPHRRARSQSCARRVSAARLSSSSFTCSSAVHHRHEQRLVSGHRSALPDFSRHGAIRVSRNKSQVASTVEFRHDETTAAGRDGDARAGRTGSGRGGGRGREWLLR